MLLFEGSSLKIFSVSEFYQRNRFLVSFLPQSVTWRYILDRNCNKMKHGRKIGGKETKCFLEWGIYVRKIYLLH